MQVNIEVPDDLLSELREKWGDVPRHALESLAVEAYRTGVWGESKLRRVLNLESRFQVHELLKERGVPLNYGEADLDQDIATLKSLGLLPSE